MFIEDLSMFFNPSEFATGVQVAGVDMDVVFDNGYAQASVGSIGMATSQPSIMLPTALVPPDWEGATVVIPGEPTYMVAAHEPDGTGVSRLLLEAA
jgi:hypothetical protein